MRAPAPIEAQIAYAAKELERMLSLYPGMVRTGVMPAQDASDAIELQTAILSTLHQVERERAARSVPVDEAIHRLMVAAQHLRVAVTPLIIAGN